MGHILVFTPGPQFFRLCPFGGSARCHLPLHGHGVCFCSYWRCAGVIGKEPSACENLFASSLKATLEWGDAATCLNLIPTSTSWDQPVSAPPPGGHAGLSCWDGDELVKAAELWAMASKKCLSHWLRSAQHLLPHFYRWTECYWGLFFLDRSEGTQLIICDPSHGSEGEGLTSLRVKL